MEKIIVKNMLIAEVCKRMPCMVKEGEEGTFLIPANLSGRDGLVPLLYVDPIVDLIARGDIDISMAVSIIADKLNCNSGEELVHSFNQMVNNFDPKRVYGRLIQLTEESARKMYEMDVLFYFPLELHCNKDIAVQFQYCLDEKNGCIRSVPITAGIVEAMGLNVTDLYRLAKENVSLEKFEFNDGYSWDVKELLSNPEAIFALDEETRGILSTPTCFYIMREAARSGAFCMLSDTGKFFLKKLAQKSPLKRVVIIPSSTNEVLLIKPEFDVPDVTDPKELADIIIGVNSSNVIAADEVLYDRPLVYDLAKDEIRPL